jgi:hypothetical protein
MWVAGLLEGEGCFRLHRDNQTWGSRKYVYLRPRVVCSMTDQDVIERLQELTGMGRIALGRKTNPGYKPYWQWTVSRDGDALELMRAVYPHMGERRRAKIEEIFTWWRTTELIPMENRRRSPRRLKATSEPEQQH